MGKMMRAGIVRAFGKPLSIEEIPVPVGEIKLRSRRHWHHSALLIEHEDTRVMIDFGVD